MSNKSKDAPADTASETGFQIFDKSGDSGQQIAINFTSGAVVETNGPGKFFAYIGGRQHPISSEKCLEEIVGAVQPARE